MVVQQQASKEEAAPLKSGRPEAATPEIPQIRLGDCLDILPTLDPQSIHLVVTDPPYFLDGLDTKWTKGGLDVIKGTGSVGGLPPGMKFDPQQGKNLQQFMERVGELLIEVMKPGAFGAVFSQPRLVHRMAVGLEDAGFEIRDLYAWHYTRRAQFKAFSMDHFVERMDASTQQKTKIKRRLDGRKTPQLRPQFEAIVLIQKPKDGTHIENWLEHQTGLINPRARQRGMAPATVMNFEKPQRERYNGHLAVKPVPLVEHLIELFSVPGQTVLDPFIGSGTTALAARNKGRNCIGIEINPSYIEIAQKRFEEYDS